MKKIIVFNLEEEEILNKISSTLDTYKKFDELSIIKSNQIALNELAKSISRYPSIITKQQLGSVSRSIETLIEMMCSIENDDLFLHIPTKAVLGKGFSIAKINFFVMLFYLCEEIIELKPINESIITIILNNIYTIMAEEVFVDIITDGSISKDIRINAVYLIVNIWEYRLYLEVKKFAPILTNIWKARETFSPIIGTLLGLSELFMMSMNIDSVWLDFLQNDEISDEEIASLEEFIFGFSYEEIQQLREKMKINGISSITKKEANRIIGDDRVYPAYDIIDPRDLYRSYKHRKRNAKYRFRAKTEGPQKTLEEYFMCYLLSFSHENIALQID